MSERSTAKSPSAARQRGSALVMAMFVLVLISAAGISLLFLSQTESRMGRADSRAKAAFFVAESGLEDGRTSLFITNGNGDLSDDLVAAAGPNGVIDFDPDALEPVFDAGGAVTGFTGYGDDVPVRDNAVFADGRYIAFLTNDPLEGATSQVDLNGRAMITAAGAVTGRSTETVQAIIEIGPILPTPPPATLTLLGPLPDFESGNSNAKDYIGDDCDGAGVPGLDMPIVGAVSDGAESTSEAGVNKPGTFNSGSYSGLDTVANLTDPTEPTVASGLGPIDPRWTDCALMLQMAEDVRDVADVVCPRGASCVLPSTPPAKTIFVDDDLTLGPGDTGTGMLFVTGRLTLHGKTGWSGMIFVVGEGEFRRNGGGNGKISGAMVVADIAGPDNVFDTADDCTGGTGGFDRVSYDERGGGNGDTVYCTIDIANATPVRPYDIVDFLQR